MTGTARPLATPVLGRSLRAALTAAVVAAGCLAGCGVAADHAPLPTTPATYSEGAATAAPAPTVEVPLAPLAYVDVTQQAGIDFVHQSGAYGDKLLPETMGAGCAFLDYDGDGDSDLLLLNGDWWPGHEQEGARPTSRLYRNDGDWKFVDVTAEVGLDFPFYAMGVATADADGDGDTDIFLSGLGGYRYLRNDRDAGGSKFVDVTAAVGLDPGTWTDAEGNEHGMFSTSALWFDADGDGDLDLFVCHYVRWSVETDVPSSMDGKTKSYATPTQYDGESCRLWRNLGASSGGSNTGGGIRFEDATRAAGLWNDAGKSLGACVFDADDDGDLDLTVSNDTQPDFFYVNQGDGTFVESGTISGMAYLPNGRAGAGMGMDAAVWGDEGRVHLAIGNFSGEPTALFQRRGRVFVNVSDRSKLALASEQLLTFGLRFVDADLDGTLDLMTANGHIEPTIQAVHADQTYAQRAQLLRGHPGGTLEEITDRVGTALATPRVGRGLALADLDGDRDLDVCITTNGGPPVLLRCDLDQAGARGLRITVVGTAPNTDAIGARVEVTAGGRKQVQVVRSGGSYLSQSELALTFGLGDAGRASQVLVAWPDGHTKTLTDVPPSAVTVIR